MKKSGRKLAIAAILAGSVIATMGSCQRNVSVYGPPPEDHVNANEADSAETSEVSDDKYYPEDNITPDVYGPPSEF